MYAVLCRRTRQIRPRCHSGRRVTFREIHETLVLNECPELPREALRVGSCGDAQTAARAEL